MCLHADFGCGAVYDNNTDGDDDDDDDFISIALYHARHAQLRRTMQLKYLM